MDWAMAPGLHTPTSSTYHREIPKEVLYLSFMKFMYIPLIEGYDKIRCQRGRLLTLTPYFARTSGYFMRKGYSIPKDPTRGFSWKFCGRVPDLGM